MTEKLIEVVPDQIIAYLAEHDIYDPRTILDIPKLLEEPDKLTYDLQCNGVFIKMNDEVSWGPNKELREEKLRMYNLERISSIPSYLVGAGSIPGMSYLEKRLQGLPVDDTTIAIGPYGHGGEFAGTFDDRRGIIDSDSVLNTLGWIAKYSVHTVPQGIMGEIDTEKRKDIDFEKNYIQTLENILVAIPKIITMAARDPSENFNWINPQENTRLFEDIVKEPYLSGWETDQYERRSEFLKKSSKVWKQIADTVSSKVTYKKE